MGTRSLGSHAIGGRSPRLFTPLAPSNKVGPFISRSNPFHPIVGHVFYKGDLKTQLFIPQAPSN